MVNPKCDGSRASIDWLQKASNQGWLPLNLSSAVLTGLWLSGFIKALFIFSCISVLKAWWHAQHHSATALPHVEHSATQSWAAPKIDLFFSNCVSLIRFSAFVFSFMGQILTGSLLHHTTNPLQKPALSLLDCDKVWHDALLKRKIPERNGSQGHPVTSRSQKPSQTSHNKQLSVATLIKKQRCDPFLFTSHLHHSLFLMTSSYISLSSPAEQVC